MTVLFVHLEDDMERCLLILIRWLNNMGSILQGENKGDRFQRFWPSKEYSFKNKEAINNKVIWHPFISSGCDGLFQRMLNLNFTSFKDSFTLLE